MPPAASAEPALCACGYVAVWMAALEQVTQPVAHQLERIVKFVDFLGLAGQFSGIDVCYEFLAEARRAANAAGHQQRNNFTGVLALELQFATAERPARLCESYRPYREIR